jgi:hypothetical protein
MKYKKFVVAGVFLFLMVVVVFYYLYKEPFQPSSSSTKDILTIIDSFCNKQYGEHWNIDSLVIFNEKLVFVVVQTKEHKIDLSIQPDIRTIIIEQMSSPPNQTRIFRY